MIAVTLSSMEQRALSEKWQFNPPCEYKVHISVIYVLYEMKQNTSVANLATFLLIFQNPLGDFFLPKATNDKTSNFFWCYWRLWRR